MDAEQPLRFGIWGGTIGIGIFADSLCSHGLLHYHGKAFGSWQVNTTYGDDSLNVYALKRF